MTSSTHIWFPQSHSYQSKGQRQIIYALKVSDPIIHLTHKSMDHPLSVLTSLTRLDLLTESYSPSSLALLPLRVTTPYLAPLFYFDPFASFFCPIWTGLNSIARHSRLLTALQTRNRIALEEWARELCHAIPSNRVARPAKDIKEQGACRTKSGMPLRE